MSGLIKGTAAHTVRSFLDPIEPVPAPAGDPRIEALERQIGELRSALAAQRAESEKAVAAARTEGERQGKAAADDAAAKRVAALGKGVDSAVSAWRDRLAGLEGLTASLAKAALAKLFDEHGGHARFVASVIARQMRLLRRDSLVAIRVSAADFTDDQALAALGAEAGTGSVRLVADADLASGECRIDLQLGHIDIGAATQWAQLAAFLDELAAAEEGR
jgi:flagellar biosynthesis/type III secretory pathway protein FliH